MFHKILVAVDRSEMSRQVFEEALTLATQTQARLLLLHVLSSEEAGSPVLPMQSGLYYYPVLNTTAMATYQQQWEDFVQQGVDWLRSLAQEAEAVGVPVEFMQTPGNPGRVICQQAKNWEADLIILGRRGLSGLSELLMGSVSNYVLHRAACSVLTVHRAVPSVPQASQDSSVEVQP